MQTLLLAVALLGAPPLDFHPVWGASTQASQPRPFELLILSASALDVTTPAALGHALTALGWIARMDSPAARADGWGQVLFITPEAALTDEGRAAAVAWRASGRRLATISGALEGARLTGAALDAGVGEVEGIHLAASTADLGRLAFALDAWAQDHLRRAHAATGGDPP
ncbi:hypothetical protein KKF91_18905 [Myxococcota bacterium]|nr:hypothetical protein [Myxococcota bacterium]MBU1432614.1 hypothetical protein [Myxococcota bacterium]MBU1899523.1 hypothetical protein [Myxococcota bacterium]